MNDCKFNYATAIESCHASGQDRAVVVQLGSGLVIALADGAGGTGNGAAAADAVILAVIDNPAACTDAESLLYRLDDPARLGGGQTTAVVISLAEHEISGASVGDSGAWIINNGSIVDLTRGQRRKPLLGDGCTPVAFSTTLPPGSTLLVASDGLLRYAKSRDIVCVASQEDIAAAMRELIALVRLPSGGLQDDVSLVLCRRTPSP